MRASEYRPVPRRLGGDTPNPGALELSLASVLLPLLALASVARGVGEAVAPSRTHTLNPTLARLIGLAEAAIGIGLAISPDKRSWLLARAALDAAEGLDRAGGGGGVVSIGRRAVSVAVDLYAAQALAPAQEAHAARLERPAELSRTVTIGKAAQELHQLARQPGIVAQCWAPMAEIEDIGDGRTRWNMHGLRFESETTGEREGERIDWRAVNGVADLEGALIFHPAPKDRGTEVTLQMRLPPNWQRFAGPALQALEMGPKAMLYTALSRFKAIAETGAPPRLHPLPSARHQEGNAHARAMLERRQ